MRAVVKARLLALSIACVLLPADSKAQGFEDALLTASPPGRLAVASSLSAAQRQIVDPDVFENLSPVHRRMLLRLMDRTTPTDSAPAPCFTPGMAPEAIAAFERAVWGGLRPRFRQIRRWSVTAISGAGLARGDPTVLTYSFVPDGTPIPGGVGEPASPSDLIAFMNSLYGTPAVWQQIFHGSFDRWSELTGVTYVFEAADDGASFSFSQGIVGVRGDVRIGGHPIDGQSGSNILAYNFFPDNGDMVLDTLNSIFYSNTANNSRAMRNLIAHEHGHGLGMDHVCPRSATKLMEPFITSLFDGPQHDDILNGQRFYGDANEDNDSVATATSLGLVSPLRAASLERRVGAPSNDDCSAARVISAVPFSSAGTTSAATLDGSSTCGGGGTGPDVWFSYTPSIGGFVTIDTFGSGFDTVLSVHPSCPGLAGNTLACDDDTATSTESELTLPVVAGTTYLIRLAGFGAAAGPYTINLSGPDPGPPGVGSDFTVRDVSIDDDLDVDFYSFTPAASQVELALRPFGLTYAEGPQAFDGSCDPLDEAPFDSLAIADLGFEVLDTDGVTVLASGIGTAAGETESVSLVLATSGPYFIRVFSEGSVDNVQLYELDITFTGGLPLGAKHWKALE